ncbi:MAG: type II toxin-antitoxin system RelE/ParE family toxin [Candidatus Bathyarchaeia archaeon]
MRFQVLLHPKAAKFLAKIPASLKNRIRDSLKELEDSPEEKGEQLKPSHFWRLRIGEYRAIYEIDTANHRVIVLYVGHRKNVYDDFSRLL